MFCFDNVLLKINTQPTCVRQIFDPAGLDEPTGSKICRTRFAQDQHATTMFSKLTVLRPTRSVADVFKTLYFTKRMAADMLKTLYFTRHSAANMLETSFFTRQSAADVLETIFFIRLSAAGPPPSPPPPPPNRHHRHYRRRRRRRRLRLRRRRGAPRTNQTCVRKQFAQYHHATTMFSICF